MNVSGAQADKIKTLLQGAALGFLVAAIGGQFWPGYMLDSNVKATSDAAIESANNASASLICQDYYLNAPDAPAKLVTFRALDSYRISQDTDLNTASERAIKRFKDAKIMPEPSSYRVKNDCGEALHKKPAIAAEMKK